MYTNSITHQAERECVAGDESVTPNDKTVRMGVVDAAVYADGAAVDDAEAAEPSAVLVDAAERGICFGLHVALCAG
jgi:hypothetical protein